jgi:hypothetical protein
MRSGFASGMTNKVTFAVNHGRAKANHRVHGGKREITERVWAGVEKQIPSGNDKRRSRFPSGMTNQEADSLRE